MPHFTLGRANRLSGVIAMLFSLPIVAADAPLAVVNGTTIPASHLEVLKKDRASKGVPSESINQTALIDTLVSMEVLAQEAEKRGLDKRDDVQAVLQIQRKEVLIKLLQDDFVRAQKIDDARLKAEYDKARAKTGGMEYHARHILVEDEKTAKDIIAKLGGKKPAKFEDLAKKHSKDSSSQQGGDLGWMTPGNLVPEFATAMVALKKGEHTLSPVKSQFGWHVIRLEESRKLEIPEFSKVKDRIANQLIQADFRKFLTELREKAKIQLKTN